MRLSTGTDADPRPNLPDLPKLPTPANGLGHRPGGHLPALRSGVEQVDTEALPNGTLKRLKNTLLYAPHNPGRSILAGRIGVFVVFFIRGWSFLLMTVDSNQIGQSFMYNINLVVQEAGHVIFRPFGESMTVLGDSLSQLSIPPTVMIGFTLRNADNFGASP